MEVSDSHCHIMLLVIWFLEKLRSCDIWKKIYQTPLTRYAASSSAITQIWSFDPLVIFTLGTTSTLHNTFKAAWNMQSLQTPEVLSCFDGFFG
jgi:hypothetical protein